VLSAPAGWYAPVTHNSSLPGDGYAIEFYNLLGSPIAPGASATFSFASSDTPAQLMGNSYISSALKVTTSYVYTGAPQGDPGLQFNLSIVPEPSSLILAALGMTVVVWLAILRISQT
jgi:hypothetical protein